MAEFCLECWRKITDTTDSRWRYVLSREKDLCEECGQYKRVIVVERRWSRIHRAITEALEIVRSGEID